MTTGHAGGRAGDFVAGCAKHPDAVAGYQCCECGQLLCHRCVEIGSHLIFCGLCGERAIELDELERHRATLAGTAPPAPPAATSPRRVRPHASPPSTIPQETARNDPAGQDPPGRTPRRGDAWQPSAPPPTTPGTAAATFAVNHVVVPAATIAMVAALLFFLLDVRSVFLSGTEALKWVGFCFVCATVLIARYGRTSANASRQGCYTQALAGATVVAMTVSPWANPTGAFGGSLANLLIILLVWRFATRLTQRLSFEGLREKAPEPRLYGVERLRLEQWRRDHDEPPAKTPRKTRDDGDNPVIPVARLAAAGLLAFALGEPFLLSGPAATGERALGAMILFLLAAAIVLAAASGLGTLRRVRSLGGQASLGMLPGRIAAAGTLMVVLAALALAMPGIETQGTGDRRPAAAETGTSGGDSGQTEDDASESGQPAEAQPQSDRSSSEPQPAAEKSSPPATGLSKAATSLVGQLAELGRWLRIGLIIIAVLLAIWALGWILSHLSGTRQWLTSTLGHWLRQLRAGIDDLLRQLLAVRFLRRSKKQRRTRRIDPFADWQALRQLEPREAVIDAYGRLLATFERLEHPRRERQTPYEFLASIPARLERLGDPAKDLTEAYVKAAYSGVPIDASDRRGAFAALEVLEVQMKDVEAKVRRRKSGVEPR